MMITRDLTPPPRASLLIAGIGNIFMGDDAFGVEVAKALTQRPLPERARVVDFGIRSYDLAYALTDGYEAVILVDATPRGAAPGTTFALELDLGQLPTPSAEAPDGHRLDPVRVLQLARQLGKPPEKLFLIGCEPAVIQAEEVTLSEVVREAIPQAIELIHELVGQLLKEMTVPPVGAA